MPDSSCAGDRSISDSGASAFPELPSSLDEPPLIPGGWTSQTIDLGARVVEILRPADPDRLLDDAAVLRANEENDYMPYWAFLWPSAEQMARAMQHAPWKAGSDVLELGSGLGLVGLAAQLRGDRVTYSDYDQTALRLSRMNALGNGLADPPTLRFDWRAPISKRFPALIGCEVTYDAAMHPVILDLLDVNLACDGVCWLGDPGRYQSPFFYDRARTRGFDIQILNEHGESIAEPSSQGFQIFELRRASFE